MNSFFENNSQQNRNCDACHCWYPKNNCCPPIIVNCATGPVGPTAPSIYAQHGNCRNHAAFHYLKDN